MLKRLATVAAAALLIVSVLLIFIPELRAAPMLAVLAISWVVTAGSIIWRVFKSGALTMTPGQIFRMPVKPNISALEVIAILLGSAAIMVTAP